ncbi:unnamed protein product [Toxocara canis]|uniref:CTD nuclear envelope phosphatase 1 homolog n=1 Tax=Toxocara canis TaxID=6265 RepID=A0A183UIG1_TOXCA|nr:unnamed protein product [Toxocara canis]
MYSADKSNLGSEEGGGKKRVAGVVRRKILVLDLDETLIHSHHDGVIRPMVKPGTPPDFILRVNIDRHPVRFFVHCRPHVDYFLSMVSQWFDLVVFTASMEIYGSSVADKLDNGKGILQRRYFRQHCTMDYGGYTKDLSAIHADLSSIFILDNSPGAYRKFPQNAIPIRSWYSDPTDTCLLALLPFLDALRFASDVRSILSRNQQLQGLCSTTLQVFSVYHDTVHYRLARSQVNIVDGFMWFIVSDVSVVCNLLSELINA